MGWKLQRRQIPSGFSVVERAHSQLYAGGNTSGEMEDVVTPENDWEIALTEWWL